MSEQNDIVIDVETTMNSPVGNNKANPFWPGNNVVMWGSHTDTWGAVTTSTSVVCDGKKRPKLTLIGHNITFDLHYIRKNSMLSLNKFSSCGVWDTQLADYLLTWQQSAYPTLDECTLKYGGVVKDSVVTDFFKRGEGADKVPKHLLEEYLKGDLRNTRLVYTNQLQAAAERDMLPLMFSQMEARQATSDMEWNGMAVDKSFLEEQIVILTKEVEDLTHVLKCVKVAGTPFTYDLTKPLQLSKWLYGGVVKTAKKVQDGNYKNGNIKWKTVSEDTALKGVCDVPLPSASTDDEALNKIMCHTELSWLAPMLAAVIEYRKKSKNLSTYFVGVDNLVMPDGMIHHNLNHCVTRTGRLSGTNPNLQNVTDGSKSLIKKAFVSRWGDNGVILEADYQQLEIVVLAVLSGDKQLMKDITDGVDIHTALYFDMYGRAPTLPERKHFKRCTFALVYGAGASGIATQSGLSLADAKRFVSTFYTRYVGVRKWHDDVFTKVVAGRVNMGTIDKDSGLPVGESVYISPVSNRAYVFKEYPHSPEVAKWKGVGASFSPTEIKNYPVQGTATGDIVPLVLGKLFRVLRNHPLLQYKCLLINTVHDSVVFDVRKDVLYLAIDCIKTTMESAPTYIKETFDYDFPLPLRVGISYGPNWLEQVEVK